MPFKSLGSTEHTCRWCLTDSAATFGGADKQRITTVIHISVIFIVFLFYNININLVGVNRHLACRERWGWWCSKYAVPYRVNHVALRDLQYELTQINV